MLTNEDEQLIAAARSVLTETYKPFWHTVSAALRMSDGRIVTGIHLGAAVGRLSICAEAVALGRAILEGGGSVVTAVAVRHPKPEEDDRDMAVVSPCGACREMFTDHAPGAMVIVPGLAGLEKVTITDLLPLPYRR
jgi:cytidine deaminase